MKKLVLTLSLFVAAMGASFGQSAIWQPHNINVDTSFGVRYMSVVDSNIAWAVVYDGSNPTRATNQITRTSNGGTFTQRAFLPDTNDFNPANIIALDSLTAYVAVYDKAADGRSGKIRKTVNGGTTWTTATDTTTMFLGANNFPDFVYFWDTMNGLCMGDPNGNTGGGPSDEFEIWRTHNAGATWTRVADANIPNPTSGEYGLTNSYTTHGKRMWYGTNKGRVYTSLDSGQTWNVNTGTIGLAGGVQGLAFRDSLNGICWGLATTTATTNTLKKTSNGGLTWSAVTIDPVNTGLYAFCAIPGRNAYMSTGVNSGNTGYVTSVTLDDGLTWNLLDMGTTAPFRMVEVQMIDSMHGWAGSFADNTMPFGLGGMNKYIGPKIAQSCPINVTATKSNICLNDSTTLTAMGAASYTWSTMATTSTVTVHPTSTTVYTVTGAAAGCVNTQTISISVTQVTNPIITVNKFDTICTGGHAVLNAGGATTYSWTPNTGLNTTTGAYVTASPTTTTSYTVTGTAGVCKSYNTFTVTVNAGITPTLTVNSGTICPTSTGTVVLTASGTSTSYSWTPATGLSSTTGASVSASPTVTTIYIVTGSLATCKSSITSTVVVSLCTGIAQVSNSNKISIYPNPSTGLVTVNIPSVNSGTIMFITDMIGKEVFKSSVNDNTVNLDLTGLQKGLYMLTITNGKSVEVQKIIIQ